MIQSMTGFGKTNAENEQVSISVEIKSLNSKFADVSIRIPRSLNDKELEMRNMISTALVRGKIGVNVDLQTKTSGVAKTSIDKELLKQYHQMLKESAAFVGEPDQSYFKTALSMPDVMRTDVEDQDNEDSWKLLKQAIEAALVKINAFRQDEGNSLKTALSSYIDEIREGLEEIILVEPIRKEAVRTKIQDQLDQLKVELNKDRFEQEIIYYLEKLDIAEEIVRLTTHLDYFTKELNGNGGGKKLGFISQEIGREINTIGSKANNAEMQQHVVKMKEALEKIKEQSLNIL